MTVTEKRLSEYKRRILKECSTDASVGIVLRELVIEAQIEMSAGRLPRPAARDWRPSRDGAPSPRRGPAAVRPDALESFRHVLLTHQIELPEAVATVLRDNLWDLYDAQPRAAVSADAPSPSALTRYHWKPEHLGPCEFVGGICDEPRHWFYLAADVDANLEQILGGVNANAEIIARIEPAAEQMANHNAMLRAEVVRLTRALEVAMSPKQDT